MGAPSTVDAWIALDAEERIAAIVEDPSICDFIAGDIESHRDLADERGRELLALRARVAELEAERDETRARSETWQSEAESWQRSHGLRVFELAEVREHLRRSESDYARMCVTVDDAADDAAESMRERAAQYLEARAEDTVPVMTTPAVLRRMAANLRALPLTDATESEER